MPDWFAPVISVIALFGVIAGPFITGIMEWLTRRSDRRQMWRTQWVTYLIEVKEKLVRLKVEMDVANTNGNKERYLEAASSFFAELGALDDEVLISEISEIVPLGIVVGRPGQYERNAMAASSVIRSVGGLIRREMNRY